jgi:hypothetical protein
MASGLGFEDRLLAATAGLDVVVVDELVVAGAEQDQLGDLGPGAEREWREVVGVELAQRGAARVLAVPGALVQGA